MVNVLFGCCFGNAPQPNHMIICKSNHGQQLPYIPGAVRVRGTFTAKEERQDGVLISLFTLSAEDIIPPANEQ